MSYLKPAIGLKSYDWSSVDLLKNLTPQSITDSREVIMSRQEHFWHDMSSEFDSKHFLMYLMNRSDLYLSDEFLEFVCLWHLDDAESTSDGFGYNNTFIFDHDTDDFSNELLIDSKNTILEVLGREQ